MVDTVSLSPSLESEFVGSRRVASFAIAASSSCILSFFDMMSGVSNVRARAQVLSSVRLGCV